MRLLLCCSLLVLLYGCQSTTVDPFAYPSDPLARAAGARWSWEPNEPFDAGIVITRIRTSLASKDLGTTSIHVAFDLSNNPVKVDSIQCNGVHLPWIATEQTFDKANIYAIDNSTIGFGTPDSMSFTYAGYDAERFSTVIPITPDFGNITIADTISISKGLRIVYQKAIPGDSIQVHIVGILADPNQVKNFPYDSLNLDKTLPDTGTLEFTPSELPHVDGIASFVIQAIRSHFSTVTSPKGKKIGIYSQMEFPTFDYPATR